MRFTPLLTIAVLLCCTALLSFAPAVSAQNTPQATPTKIYLPSLRGTGTPPLTEQEQMANQVLALLNNERAKAGCAPLSLDSKLTSAALGHSNDMAVNNFFDHRGSNGSGLGERVNASGYRWRALAENIAAGYETPSEVVAGWMQSDGHRKNILNCSYVHTGVGYVFQSDDAPLAGESWPFFRYWTQVFAAPR
jgi:uncharacterized protein YkwD